ncbi:MAG: ABC transporter substrate-binding protein [Brevibacterium sp.]|uniref:ABC transporter substrate-binding protein n=1 Tax=Brevibacterium aurantiacum TaxID=273384 RepID=A0A2A3YYG5_BREAU|nr:MULTISPECIES: ABC transporter substrate-binding protein [Brevibacterium]MDN5587355.1 ABC transporter substrate-binding protein [Brevibacterium sp.]MDN5792566.1 ABC transporter substrate-binding protein [Brevibacterium aurantiacum]MDN5805727.1 ABC transporter substrate-binding protein [Brevibacterium sp.]MDN5832808.1 ABC transporter substrate-binding protein [Brevibacterium sp.]MDN5875357.1 ABC transporter substrate-binding protein [Brevibacterium sp.]
MRTQLSIIGAVCALALAGCGGSGSAAMNNETAEANAGSDLSVPLPADWSQISGASDFSSVEADPQLPAKVTDGTNTEVEVNDIDKIIVAGDGVASTLGALGLKDNIVAAPENSTSPEGLEAPEHFEFGKETGVEGLLAMNGTLFIGDNTKRHGSVAQQFRNAGTDAVVMDDQQSQSDKLKAVASYVGAEAAGEELATLVDDQLADAANTAKRSGKTDLSIIEVTANGAGGQNAVAGTGTPGNEMIETLGYTSVGAESKLRGYSREFSSEGIVAAAPDVIVMAESDYDKWGGEDGLWKAFPTLQQTPAGKNSAIYVMPDAQLKYSSPEIGVGAQALAEAVAELP